MHWIPIGMAMVLAAGAAAPAAAAPTTAVRIVLQATDPDSLFRVAQEALTRNEYRTAVNQFAKIIKRYPTSYRAAASLYFQAFALRRLGSERDLRQALEALGTLRRRFPKLVAQASSDVRSLEVGIQGELAQRGDAKAAAQVARRAERPAHPQSDRGDSRCPQENQSRIEALNHLQKTDASGAGELIRNVLADRTDESVCLRRLAVFLLAQRLNLPNAEDQLFDVARHDPDAEVRGQAVVWLSAVKSDRAVQALDSILGQTDDNDMREKVLFALGEHNRPLARHTLRDYIDRTDVPEGARRQAIQALGRFPSEENSAFLRVRYDRFDDLQLKRQVIMTLGQSHRSDDNRWLLRLARNPSEALPLRAQAVYQASQGGAPIGVVVALYDRLPEVPLRAQLIFAYAQRPEAAAFDKLLDIATREENQELQDAAAFWLKRSKDPRAAEAVQALNQRQGR